jgi:hypothetical protein
MIKLATGSDVAQALRKVIASIEAEEAAGKSPSRSTIAASLSEITSSLLEATVSKEAKDRDYKSSLPPLLEKGAEALFNARVPVRKAQDMLHDMWEDATGVGNVSNAYNNVEVKGLKDAMYELDQNIGNVARGMENVARKIKKNGLT